MLLAAHHVSGLRQNAGTKWQGLRIIPIIELELRATTSSTVRCLIEAVERNEGEMSALD